MARRGRAREAGRYGEFPSPAAHWRARQIRAGLFPECRRPRRRRSVRSVVGMAGLSAGAASAALVAGIRAGLSRHRCRRPTHCPVAPTAPPTAAPWVRPARTSWRPTRPGSDDGPAADCGRPPQSGPDGGGNPPPGFRMSRMIRKQRRTAIGTGGVGASRRPRRNGCRGERRTAPGVSGRSYRRTPGSHVRRQQSF